jgi:hypothetical protein
MVALSGEAGGGPVHGAVSGEALEDHFGADGVDQGGRLKIVRASRSMFERMARKKDLSWPVDDIGSVLIRTDEVPDLHREMPPGSYRHDKLVRS